MTVKITRLDLTASDLRREAARTKDSDAAPRMLAIALLLEGHILEQAARQSGMVRQTLRDWVHHYDAECVVGLFDRPAAWWWCAVQTDGGAGDRGRWLGSRWTDPRDGRRGRFGV